MRGTTGILLVALGLLALYIVLSDKYGCFVQFMDCLTGADMATPQGYTQGGPQAQPQAQSNNAGGFSIWGLLDGTSLGPLFGQRGWQTPPFQGQ